MAILDILRFPDPRLRHKAQEVESFDRGISTAIEDMLETMYAAPGIGLAATQVNIHKRIVVIDLSEHQDNPLCLVNPLILESAGQEEGEEGCLSVPGFFERVVRAERIVYQALDRKGDLIKEEAKGLLAVCIQHEIDHLEGKLFVDYLSSLKRQRIRKKLEKIRKAKSLARPASGEQQSAL